MMKFPKMNYSFTVEPKNPILKWFCFNLRKAKHYIQFNYNG